MLMRPTWGPPGSCRPQMGPHVGPMNLAIRGAINSNDQWEDENKNWGSCLSSNCCGDMCTISNLFYNCNRWYAISQNLSLGYAKEFSQE